MDNRVYDILWKDIVVGSVYTNEKGEFKYIPNIENIKITSRDGMPCTVVMNPQREWKDTMPDFIRRRLAINSSNNNKTVTDNFSIVSVTA